MTDEASESPSVPFPCRLQLIGNFRIETATGRELPVRNKKNRAILAVLGLSPGMTATRDKLCGLFWPDKDEKQARGALRQTVSVLREELGDVADDLLATKDSSIALAASRIDVDALAFTQAQRNGATAETLQTLLSSARQDLLADAGVKEGTFEEWLGGERRRHHALVVALQEMLCGLLAGPDRIAAARDLVDLDELREASHRLLMEAYAAAGETALALKQYDTCRRIIQAEFSAEPSGETTQLRYRIASGVGSAASQPKAGDSDGTALLSVAILPFEVLSAGNDQQYLADGITKDVITALSRFRGLYVIASGTSFAFRGSATSPRDYGRTLGVKYIVEGNIRRYNSHARISVRLSEVVTGREIWGEHFDVSSERLFSFQDDVAQSIATALEGRLAGATVSSMRRRTSHSGAVYEQVLLARELLSTHGGEAALAVLENAIVAEPTYAQAHAWKCFALWSVFQSRPEDKIIAEAVAAGLQAVAFDPEDSLCHAHLALAHLFQRDFDSARRDSETAVALNPGDMQALSARADVLYRCGQALEALAALDTVRKRDPHPPSYYWESRAIANMVLARDQDALASLANMRQHMWWNKCYIAACQARLKRPAEAAAAIRQALEAMPGASISMLMKTEPFLRQDDHDRLVTALRAAGLPED